MSLLLARLGSAALGLLLAREAWTSHDYADRWIYGVASGVCVAVLLLTF